MAMACAGNPVSGARAFFVIQDALGETENRKQENPVSGLIVQLQLDDCCTCL